MTPANRTLLQVQMDDSEAKVTARVVQELMGNKPEDRFNFITERAQFVDVDELDV
jgi:topoisomerase-4 subunit B